MLLVRLMAGIGVAVDPELKGTIGLATPEDFSSLNVVTSLPASATAATPGSSGGLAIQSDLVSVDGAIHPSVSPGLGHVARGGKCARCCMG